MTSSPPMYGRSASGTTTLPSGCWYCSRMAIITRGSARPDPLSVCTYSGRPLAVWREADVGAARLKLLAVRAARDLQPLLAARRPHLDVVLLGGGEAQVAGAHHDHAIGQAEALGHVLGVDQAASPARRTTFPAVTNLYISTLSN